MSLTGESSESIVEASIEQDFWPSISIDTFIERYHLPDHYARAALADELTTAIILVNQELKPVTAKFTRFDDIEQHVINGELDISHHYVRAVYSEARAQLITLHITSNRKDSADNAHDQWADSIDFWQDRCRNSIQYITKRLLPESENLTNSGFIVDEI